MVYNKTMRSNQLQKQNEIIARAIGGGYVYGNNIDKDSKDIERKYVPKTEARHNQMMELYITWNYHRRQANGTLIMSPHQDVRESLRSEVLCQGALLPPKEILMDFFHFYISQSKGRITKNGRPSLDTCLSTGEFFFAGFTRSTGTVIPDDERQNIYLRLRKLYEDKVIENAHIPKYLFGQPELDRVMKGLWTRPDPRYIHERSRIQASFIIPVYCWSGARIGAFFTGTGLCYKDIHLSLQRGKHGEEVLVFKIDQRWVKNNRDPDNIIYSMANETDSRLRYDECSFLLSMAFADNALFDYKSYDELLEQRIPQGDDFVQLQWTKEAESLPVLRHIEADGTITAKPMHRATFERIFNAAVQNEGYLCPGGMHKVRRMCGKKIDENYTEVQRSQHLIQSDPRVFGASYTAHTSSVNGKKAFLNEPITHIAVDHFQGIGQFREEGLPLRLPAQLSDDVLNDSQVVHLEQLLDESKSDADRSKEIRNEIRNLKSRLKISKLKEYQKDWIREQRNRKILTRGKMPARNQDEKSFLISLFSERETLAEYIQKEEGLTWLERRVAILELISLCTRDYTTIYRPGEKPTNKDTCPVCSKTMKDFNKRSRSSHIHNCQRKQEADKLGYKEREMCYCYDCFNWVHIHTWGKHCDTHSTNFTPKSCDRLTYRNTVIREYRCGGCAGPETDQNLRLKTYKPGDFWRHIAMHHMSKIHSWPAKCFYFNCTELLKDATLFDCHLRDDHYRSVQISRMKRKREDTENEYALSTDVEDNSTFLQETNTYDQEWSRLEVIPYPEDEDGVSLDSQSLDTKRNGFSSPDCHSNDWSQSTVQSTSGIDSIFSSELQQIKNEKSPLTSTELDDLVIDPCLVDHTHNENESDQAIVDTHGMINSSSDENTANMDPKISTSCETLAFGNGHEAEAPKEGVLDPVEILRARCDGWYLTKWANWEDNYNEWRKPCDLPPNLVAQYDENFKGNSFGILVGRRRRLKGAKEQRVEVVEYEMKWTNQDRSPFPTSWLPANEVDEELINEFEKSKPLNKGEPRRKRRRKASKKY